jgi:hypothetical protein
MKLIKTSFATFSFFLLLVIIFTSCKHEAGVLDKCLGKNIVIDTIKIQGDNSTSLQVDTTTTPYTLGDIKIDTTSIKADIRKAPFIGSIDNGKTWFLLPHNFANLKVGTYKLITKDSDSCISSVYPLSVTY